MSAPHVVDPADLLGEALSEAPPDLMRSLLHTVINALLSADVEVVAGAEWAEGRRYLGLELLTGCRLTTVRVA